MIQNLYESGKEHLKDVLSHSQGIAMYLIAPQLIAEEIENKCRLVLWKKYGGEVGEKAYGMWLRADQTRQRNILFSVKMETSNHSETHSALHSEFLIYSYVAKSKRAENNCLAGTVPIHDFL